jgi:hypothetical protein
MDQEVIIQIFSGGFDETPATFESIMQKLEPIVSHIRVAKVFMGMSADKDLYAKIRDYLYKKDIEFYCWLPVFAELDALKVGRPLIDFNGKDKSDYQLTEREDFTFYCPNHPENFLNVLQVFEEQYAPIGFTGVFLDKIRYASFANGLNNVLTCFCPFCQIKYRSSQFNTQEMEQAIKMLLFKPAPFGAIAYDKGRYVFENDLWNTFFRLKNEFITNALKGIFTYFREKRYKIGLDVFAPFASHFVGQDIPELSTFVDFIKPMMYRMTNAPAGLPFELEAIVQETTSKETQREAFYKLLGFDARKQPFDLDFTVRELTDLVKQSNAPVYPGVEFNRAPIAPVTPAYMEETIKAYTQTGVQGFVMSWNLLNAPQENIDQVVKLFS